MDYQRGQLFIYFGPMFSGKSSTLIGHLTRYLDLDIPVLLVNSSLDTRECIKNLNISTHKTSISITDSKLKAYKVNELYDLNDICCIDQYDVIGIDEAQFFPDLKDFVLELLKKKKTIYVCGLDADANQKQFGQIYSLIPYAEKIEKLTSVCTKCLIHKKFIPAVLTTNLISQSKNSLQIQIGGKDLYTPLCLEHYYDR